MTLIELTKKKMAIEAELAQLKAKFVDDTSRIGKELIAVAEGINYANKGLTVEMVRHGMTIINFGDPKQSTERRGCVEDAINDIASGFNRLSERYFGTKTTPNGAISVKTIAMDMALNTALSASRSV